LATLWQHFGQAARDKQLTSTAILFTEKEHFDDERAAKAARRVKQTVMHKQTAKEASLPGTSHPLKHVALPLSNGSTHSETWYGMDMMVNANLNGTLDEESGNEDLSLISADALVLLKVLARGEDLSSRLAHAGKRRKVDFDMGTDFLINAKKRTGVMCQRKVFDVCFDNGAAMSDHHKCNTDNVQGCPHCHIMEPTVCCDIHNPSDFASYNSPNSKVPRVTQHSHLPKYTKDENDYDLEDTLLTWHEEKTVAVYRWACLYDNGPVVMMNSTLDCIINCTHHQKIQTPQDLKRETVWADNNLYASEVLSLVQRHAALHTSLFISTLLRQDTHMALSITNCITVPTVLQPTSRGDSSIPVKRRTAKCSACSQEGHNCKCSMLQST
ncbi:hypothetical protein F5141DRAFT_1011223, partial [Pisolithus sp. B1]